MLHSVTAPRRPRFSGEELGSRLQHYNPVTFHAGGEVCFLISVSVPSFCGCHNTSTRLKFCTIWCWCFLLVPVEAVHFQSHDPTTAASSSANVFVCFIFVAPAQTSSKLKVLSFVFHFFVCVKLQ